MRWVCALALALAVGCGDVGHRDSGPVTSHVPEVPIADADGDGIPDVEDTPPDRDVDGIPDVDETDGDGDGIPDHLDTCPSEPEVFNGRDDEDGCPDSVPRPIASGRPPLERPVHDVEWPPEPEIEVFHVESASDPETAHLEAARVDPDPAPPRECVAPFRPLVTGLWELAFSSRSERAEGRVCIEGDAAYAWSVPPLLRTGDPPVEVRFVVQPGATSDTAREELGAEIEAAMAEAAEVGAVSTFRGSARAADGLWTRCMAARLTEVSEEPLLDLQGDLDLVRRLEADSPEAWSWTVAPRRFARGATELQVALLAVPTGPDGACPSDAAAHEVEPLRIFTAAITVELEFWGLMSRMGPVRPWMFVALLLPLLGLFRSRPR